MRKYATASALTRCLSRRFPPSRPIPRIGLRPDAFPRLLDRQGSGAFSRLLDRQGETLAETLISLLIIVAALTILAGGITTGAQINRQADTRYAVVFPPPVRGEEAHFTKDQFNVPFRLSLRDEQLYEELSGRLALSPAETDAGAAPSPAEADAIKTVEMRPLRVKVRRELALDRSGSELTWRILYVLEDVVEKGADDETEPEENQIGE